MMLLRAKAFSADALRRRLVGTTGFFELLRLLLGRFDLGIRSPPLVGGCG
jgi:hypothetical protein